ncbi:MAG: hypothetical protein J7L14_02290 [Candidatus Diapherotrites archaeon]|nr:hypothetical protein [Candidatus Diapherotrites archaeon]
MPKQKKQNPKTILLSDIVGDIKSLHSSVLVLSQKINFLVKNEKILGKNLVVLNKKINSIRQDLDSVQQLVSSASTPKIQEMEKRLSAIESELESLKFELNDLKENAASASELKEIKHIVEAINPLEFVTLDQLKEILKKKK